MHLQTVAEGEALHDAHIELSGAAIAEEVTGEDLARTLERPIGIDTVAIHIGADAGVDRQAGAATEDATYIDAPGQLITGVGGQLMANVDGGITVILAEVEGVFIAVGGAEAGVALVVVVGEVIGDGVEALELKLILAVLRLEGGGAIHAPGRAFAHR